MVQYNMISNIWNNFKAFDLDKKNYISGEDERNSEE